MGSTWATEKMDATGQKGTPVSLDLLALAEMLGSPAPAGHRAMLGARDPPEFVAKLGKRGLPVLQAPRAAAVLMLENAACLGPRKAFCDTKLGSVGYVVVVVCVCGSS